MAAMLPPELTDRVLDHLANDPPSLRACTLAGRALRPRAQHLAFRALSLVCPVARGRLECILAANPALSTHVKTLSIACWEDARIALLEEAGFPALHTLTLRMYRPGETVVQGEDGEGRGGGRTIASAAKLIARAPALAHLKLWDCMVDPADLQSLSYAARHHGVQRLSLVDCHVFAPAEGDSELDLADFTRLHLSPPPPVIVRALCAAPPPRLTALSCTYVGLDEGLGMRALAEALPNLEHLRLEFDQREAFQFARSAALDLSALTSLRTLYVEAILTAKHSPHERYFVLAPRLLANLITPSPPPAIIVLHVHASPCTRPSREAAPGLAAHVWAPCRSPAPTPTELVLDFHDVKEDRVMIERTARDWWAAGPARDAPVKMRWRPARVPTYGLEERFMERCSV